MNSSIHLMLIKKNTNFFLILIRLCCLLLYISEFVRNVCTNPPKPKRGSANIEVEANKCIGTKVGETCNLVCTSVEYFYNGKTINLLAAPNSNILTCVGNTFRERYNCPCSNPYIWNSETRRCESTEIKTKCSFLLLPERKSLIIANIHHCKNMSLEKSCYLNCPPYTEYTHYNLFNCNENSKLDYKYDCKCDTENGFIKNTDATGCACEEYKKLDFENNRCVNKIICKILPKAENKSIKIFDTDECLDKYSGSLCTLICPNNSHKKGENTKDITFSCTDSGLIPSTYHCVCDAGYVYKSDKNLCEKCKIGTDECELENDIIEPESTLGKPLKTCILPNFLSNLIQNMTYNKNDEIIEINSDSEINSNDVVIKVKCIENAYPTNTNSESYTTLTCKNGFLSKRSNWCTCKSGYIRIENACEKNNTKLYIIIGSIFGIIFLSGVLIGNIIFIKKYKSKIKKNSFIESLKAESLGVSNIDKKSETYVYILKE